MMESEGAPHQELHMRWSGSSSGITFKNWAVFLGRKKVITFSGGPRTTVKSTWGPPKLSQSTPIHVKRTPSKQTTKVTISSDLVGQTASGGPSYIQVRHAGADFRGPGALKHQSKSQKPKKRIILSPLSDLLQTLWTPPKGVDRTCPKGVDRTCPLETCSYCPLLISPD